MAALTDQLSTVNSGKAIIPTKVETPSFMGGLAKVISGADSVFSNIDQTRRANESAARAARTEERKVAIEGAQAQAERDVFNTFLDFRNANSGNTVSVDVVNDTLQPYTGAAEAAARDLGLTKKAVDQGRVPTSALDLQLERVQADLMQKYPEYSHEIAQYLQGRGFDSYIFRDIKSQVKFEETVRETEREAFKSNYDFAVSKGVPADPNNPQAVAVVGSQLRGALFQQEQAKAAKDAARQAKEDGRADYKFMDDIAEKQLANGLSQEAAYKLSAMIPTLSNLINAAGDDPQKQQRINELAPQVLTTIESVRAQGKAQITTADGQRAWDSQIDTYKKAAEDLFSGTLSQHQTNLRIYNGLQTQFKLDATKALPTYTYLSTIFDKNTLAELFGGNIASVFPADTVTKLQQEFDGLKTADAREGQVIVNNIAQIIKGDRKLKDMSEREARQAMPGLIKSVEGNQRAIIAGDKDPQSVDAWRNSYSALLNAAVEIQPGTADVNSVLSASSLVSSRDARSVMQTMMANGSTKEQAQAVALGSRGAAAQLLEVSKSLPVPKGGVEIYDAAFDPKTGRYFAKADKKAYEVYAARTRGSVGGFGPQAGLSFSPRDIRDIPVSSAVAKKVDALNLNLNHLVETAQYDPEIPKGTTPLQLADHYATGKPLVRTDSAGKPVKSADQQFNDSANAVRDELKRIPSVVASDPTMSFKGASISAGNAVSRLEGYGVPRHIAAGIVGNLAAESGLNTGAVGDKNLTRGPSTSLAQWEPSRRQYAAESGFDLSNPNDALDFILHELNTTESGAKEKLMKAKTPEEAAHIFMQYYERPNAELANADKRKAYARQFAGAD